MLSLIGLLLIGVTQSRYANSPGGRFRLNTGSSSTVCNNGRWEVYGPSGWGLLQDCSAASSSYFGWYTYFDADDFCRAIGFQYAVGSSTSNVAMVGQSTFNSRVPGRTFSSMSTAYSYFSSGFCSTTASTSTAARYTATSSFCASCGDDFSRSASSSIAGDDTRGSYTSSRCSSSSSYNVMVNYCARCTVGTPTRNSATGVLSCTGGGVPTNATKSGYSCTSSSTNPTSTTTCYAADGYGPGVAAAVAAFAAWLVWVIVIISVCCLIIIIVICVCIFGGVACCAAAASPTPVAGQPVVMTTTSTV